MLKQYLREKVALAALLLNLDNVSSSKELMNTSMTVEQRKLLDLHLQLILEVNKTTNLTRITDWDQGQLLHVEDSLFGLPALLKAPKGRYADLGTGGGFPGIPLAIMSGCQTLLVDSVKKKITALESVIHQLGLQDQISTYAGRIEDLSLQQPESLSVITARALSSLPSLLELASPLLRYGGHLICYKSNPDQDELDTAKNISHKLGMEYSYHYEGYLSDNTTHRMIIVYTKVSEPEVALPRRVGMAQKKPFKS